MTHPQSAVTMALVALLACSHPEPFSPEPPGGTGPFVPGPPAQLTVGPDEESWPSWVPAGGVLHSWASGRPDGDRCIGLLPDDGGQRTAEYCPDYPGQGDTTDYLQPAVLDASGRLAYYNERSLAGFPGTTVQELRLGALDARPEESLTLASFPIPGPAGRPVVAVSHLTWLGTERLAMVLVERLVFAICPLCPLDTLVGGRALATLDVVTAPNLPEALDHTTDASSLDLDPSTGSFYFTVIGESVVYRIPVAGGAPELVFDFGPVGIVRDVAVDDGAVYVVAGGLVTVVPTTNGLMQEDAGGRVLRLDLDSGQVTPLTPEDGPYYRRLALDPDGRRLLAERNGNLWLIPLDPA